MSSSLLYQREGGRLQDRVGDRGDDLTVLFGLSATGDPFRIGGKPSEALRPVIERFPFEHVGKILIRRPDKRGPEPGLLDAVLLPEWQGQRVEPLDQVRQATGNAVIYAQLIDHRVLLSGELIVIITLVAPRSRQQRRARPRRGSAGRSAGRRAAGLCARRRRARLRTASTPVSRSR